MSLETLIQLIEGIDDEVLGEQIRLLWVEKQGEVPNPKPSHMVPWADLDDWNKEVDRYIGKGLVQFVLNQIVDQVKEH